MTGIHPIHSEPNEKLEQMLAMYRRLGQTDPPAPRSLARELKRLSDESFASAALEVNPAAQLRARREARHSDAARAALDSLATGD